MLRTCIRQVSIGLLCLISSITSQCLAQSPDSISPNNVNNTRDALQPGRAFIENVGQYGASMKGFEQMGPIRFGYEGFNMPVLFTPKGLIYLQRKIDAIDESEMDNADKDLPEEELEKRKKGNGRGSRC